MAEFNWVDYTILGIFFFSTLMGLARGLVKEILSLGTLVAAFAIASIFASPLAAKFTSSPAVQGVVNQATSTIGASAAQPISYFAIGTSFTSIFLGTMLVGTVIGYLVNAFFQVGMLGFGNRMLGGVFGLARGFIVNLIFVFLMQLSPLAEQPWWQQSSCVAAFQPAVVWLGNIVSPSLANLKERFGKTMQDVTSQIQGATGSISSFSQ